MKKYIEEVELKGKKVKLEVVIKDDSDLCRNDMWISFNELSCIIEESDESELEELGLKGDESDFEIDDDDCSVKVLKDSEIVDYNIIINNLKN